jgi:DNA adenine methylase
MGAGVTTNDITAKGNKMLTSTKPKPLTRWFGGKAKMAPIIAEKVASISHDNWIEPFCGMSGVTMAKPPSKVELINDRHSGLITLYRVVRNKETCQELIHQLEFTPYAREEWHYCNDNWATETDLMEVARMVYVTLAQNFVGVTKNGSWSFGGAKHDGNVARRFHSSLDNIKAVCKRLQGVIIENADAFDIIRQWEAVSDRTLFYLDPPYLPETRNRLPNEYLHEMTYDDHVKLLNWCVSSQCKIILSGYPSDLYSRKLLPAGWYCEKYSAVATSALRTNGNGLKDKPGGNADRVECLWFSPNIAPRTLWDFEKEV